LKEQVDSVEDNGGDEEAGGVLLVRFRSWQTQSGLTKRHPSFDVVFVVCFCSSVAEGDPDVDGVESLFLSFRKLWKISLNGTQSGDKALCEISSRRREFAA
jgi:hypothetical protein